MLQIGIEFVKKNIIYQKNISFVKKIWNFHERKLVTNIKKRNENNA